jgi:DNA topoisomerase-3
MHAAAGELPTMWRSSRDADAVDRFDQRGDAETVAERTKAAGTGTVVDVAVREENVSAPRLFDLTDLQREANKRHGLTAAKTLAAAQALYETHKFLSYPRTDSRFLTSDMAALVPTLVTRVKAADAAYAAAADAVAAACDPTVVINDAKVNDHHAIIPTDAAHDLSVLSADERKVYDLVVRRFLAALLPPQRLERTVVWVSVGGVPDLFRAAGRRELEPGFRIAWPESTKDAKGSKGAKGGKDGAEDGDDEEAGDDGVLPAVTVGEVVRVGEVEVAARQTKPPARFNEASLLGQMSTAGRLVTDEEAAEAMKESGLGTPATRAATVEKLISVEYLERQGRQLRATSKGRGVILALGDHPLVSPDLTGSWERRLHEMERSTPDEAAAQRRAFDADVRAFATEITAGFSGMTPDRLAVGRRVVAPCPVPGCEGSVVESKRGWGCDSWKSREEPGCGFSVWKEQSGKRVTEKELARRIDDVRTGKVTVTPPGQRVVLGECPRCDGSIVERQQSWGCSSWRSPKQTGCGYVIWKKDPDGTPVDEARARDLLALGRTNEREKPPAFAPCPRCDGSIVEREKFYGCDSWRSPRQSGCGTVVWKVQAGSAVTAEVALAQLEEMKGTPSPAKKKPSRKQPGRK